MKFYICDHCRNIIEMVDDKGVKPSCCGQTMRELLPGTTDGALEKHVPDVKCEGNKVSAAVGSVEHPMLEEHYIAWIVLETDKGVYRKNLKSGEKPQAEFILAEGEKAVAVYEYCNLHGLWKKEL